MFGVRRSAGAWRDRGITAGVILILTAVWPSVPVKAQSTSPSPKDVTALSNPENETTSFPTMSENLTAPLATKQSNLTTERAPLTAVTLPPTTTPLPDLTSSANSTKNKNTSMIVPVSDELSTHPGITTNNNAEWAPGGDDGDDDEFDAALAVEFFVVIIVTILVIVAVMIIVAALVFFCCRRRAEEPTRFVKFKKRTPKHKYDKMDVEMSTLPRKHEPAEGGSWIFSANGAGDDDREGSEAMDLNLSPALRTVTNDNYDPEVNGNIETAPSISDYHSEGNHATLELEDDDNDLNVNPMYSSNGHSNRGSNKDSGIHVNGSDVGLIGDGETSIRSDTDLQSFADDSVEL